LSEGDNIAMRVFRTGQPATNSTPTAAGNARITNGLSVEADVVIAADGIYSTLQRYVVKPAGRCSPGCGRLSRSEAWEWR
jgi:2-polyprenyl-6-methoxyphenol hydroxylase-like FAD-dependent oxidoreductase